MESHITKGIKILSGFSFNVCNFVSYQLQYKQKETMIEENMNPTRTKTYKDTSNEQKKRWTQQRIDPYVFERRERETPNFENVVFSLFFQSSNRILSRVKLNSRHHTQTVESWKKGIISSCVLSLRPSLTCLCNVLLVTIESITNLFVDRKNAVFYDGF